MKPAVPIFLSIVLLAAALVSHSTSAQIVVEEMTVDQPRTFGYKIGDKFERSIHLQLRNPFELDLGSLPSPGRLTEWLAVEAPEIELVSLAASTKYRIVLRFQIVNVKAGVASVAVPHQNLAFTDGTETLNALVPASRVAFSVLRESNHAVLQPNNLPARVPYDYRNSLIFGILFPCALIGLAVLYWGSPFSTATRPFAETHRELAKRRHRTLDNETYCQILQRIHQAFNETAGRTVFADRLDDFFLEHAQYSSLQQEIEHYFQHSREYFFDNTRDIQKTQCPLQDLIALVRACSDIERGLA